MSRKRNEGERKEIRVRVVEGTGEGETRRALTFRALSLHIQRIYDVEAKYYADGEDAYDMRKPLVPGGVPPKKGRRPKSG